jgi:hypothetical protein
MTKEIKIHKELNQEPIRFEKELGIKFYKECIFKFNKIEDLNKEIIFSFDELRNNFSLNNQDDFKEFMRFFHNEIDGRKSVFKTDKGDLIGGGVFSTKIYTDNRLGVMINPYHKQYIYSKIDIDKWHSVKGNHKKINALELAEEEKNKLTGMMTTFLSDEIKGKYTQRLLDLLMQYKGSGFFIMEWDKFKEILEVPKSYRARDIDKQIMEKSKEELEKIGLKITKIEKIKKGRSIETIKIKFDFERKKEEKKQDIKDPVLVEEQAQNTTEFDKELGKLSTILMKKKKANLIMQLSRLKTLEDIQEFKEKNQL